MLEFIQSCPVGLLSLIELCFVQLSFFEFRLEFSLCEFKLLHFFQEFSLNPLLSFQLLTLLLLIKVIDLVLNKVKLLLVLASKFFEVCSLFCKAFDLYFVAVLTDALRGILVVGNIIDSLFS